MKTSMLLWYFLLSMPISAIANGTNLYNVKQIVVYGVSIGDDREQVIDVLSEYLSVSPNELSITEELPEGVDEPSVIAYSNASVNININIEPELGTDTNSKSLTTLLVFGGFEYDFYLKEAVERFGPPTIVSKEGLNFWCEELNATKDQCAKESARFFVSKKSIILNIRG